MCRRENAKQPEMWNWLHLWSVACNTLRDLGVNFNVTACACFASLFFLFWQTPGPVFGEIGSRHVKYLKVYSSFEFVIQLRVRLGYGGIIAWARSLPAWEKKARRNEICHFVTRDEGLRLQTMHSYLHGVGAYRCEHNSSSEVERAMAATNKSVTVCVVMWSLSLRSWRVWEAFLVSTAGIDWLSTNFSLILPSASLWFVTMIADGRIWTITSHIRGPTSPPPTPAPGFWGTEERQKKKKGKLSVKRNCLKHLCKRAIVEIRTDNCHCEHNQFLFYGMRGAIQRRSYFFFLPTHI